MNVKASKGLAYGTLYFSTSLVKFNTLRSNNSSHEYRIHLNKIVGSL